MFGACTMLSILYDEGTFEFDAEEVRKLQELRKLVEGIYKIVYRVY